MSPEEIKKLQDDNAALSQEVEVLTKQFVASDEENKELKTALAAATNEAPVKKLIKVSVVWNTPQGKKVTKKVTINTPKVWLNKLGKAVSAEGFLQVATGKEPTDSAGLEGLTQEQALGLLTHWTKIGASFIAA